MILLDRFRPSIDRSLRGTMSEGVKGDSAAQFFTQRGRNTASSGKVIGLDMRHQDLLIAAHRNSTR